MARSGKSNDTALKYPEVTFSVEIRPATSEQIEAGKRLFSRLITRAQSSIEIDSEVNKTGKVGEGG